MSNTVSKYGLYLQSCLERNVVPLSKQDWLKAGAPESPCFETGSSNTAESRDFAKEKHLEAISAQFAQLLKNTRKRALRLHLIDLERIERIECKMAEYERLAQEEIQKAKREAEMWRLWQERKNSSK